MTDPRHPMHAIRRRQELDKMFPEPPARGIAPHRYEDQYGNARWSDDHSPVVHPSKDGR